MNLENIQARKQELENAKSVLKSEFFGLDTIIDRVIDSIYAWYAFPDLITRPVIINLWGMTGVGKTQLVRRLVQVLNLSNIFVEIQMDGFSQGSSWNNHIADILDGSCIEENKPGILLLDEMQRYRTVTQKGDDAEIRRYQDVWMLLSDGKLSIDSNKFRQIEDMFLDYNYYKDRPQDKVDDDDGDDSELRSTTNSKFKISPWQARSYKSLLKLTESLEEIMTWDKDKIMAVASLSSRQGISHEKDYSKLLIFVSGNLDEVYSTAARTGDCDTDADIFHEISKRITTSDIKDALKSRFKPEQISRFGNNHVIYPSLSKHSYQQIIKVTCNKYIDKMQELTGLSFIIDPGILDEIYVNGVYPTQGTRPVFSSIHKIFSGALTLISVWALERGTTNILLSINTDEKIIIGTDSHTGDKIKIPVDLDIRVKKDSTDLDFRTLVCVHEAGHAIVGMVLNNEAPAEINISTTSWKGGYTFQLGREYTTKTQLMSDMAIGMGGLVAETLIFGDENRTAGCAKDIELASSLASNYIRNFAMSSAVNSYIWLGEDPLTNNNVSGTNANVEALVTSAKELAIKVLQEYKNLHIRLVSELLKTDKLSKSDLINMFPELHFPEKSGIPFNESWNKYVESTNA